jgi:hypothetical protein
VVRVYVTRSRIFSAKTLDVALEEAVSLRLILLPRAAVTHFFAWCCYHVLLTRMGKRDDGKQHKG